MHLTDLPLFAELASSQRILLAGAGGGFDIFCGLPLYFALRKLGKEVHLANLTFTNLPSEEVRTVPTMLKVTADTHSTAEYFPELHLANWFREQGDEVAIYCFEKTGYGPLFAAYNYLREELNLDTIILVDGGTDSLMRGDEFSLGTPHEDIASIAAVDDIDVAKKLLVCLGFGVDAFHGVCHAHFLEGVAELIKADAFLGAFSLMKEMVEAQLYKQASDYVFERMQEDRSIVSSSILSALAGEYGDYHPTDRTSRSTLWINPLMSLYWCFSLPAVANRIQYMQGMKQTQTWNDVHRVVQQWLATQKGRPWQSIPV